MSIELGPQKECDRGASIVAAHDDAAPIRRPPGRVGRLAAVVALGCVCLTLPSTARVVTPCDEALARGALEAGRCWIARGDYEAAIGPLERALATGREPEAALWLGVAQYHRGELARASRSFERARAYDPARPELMLYGSLLELETSRGEPRASRRVADRLERLRRQAPAAVEPVASYFEGLARLFAADPDRARAAFERVRDHSRGSAWDALARQELARLDERDLFPTRISLSVGAEYDDNALLLSEAFGIPAPNEGPSDLRSVWELRVATTLHRSDRWLVGSIVEYAGRAHDDLEALDLHVPRVSLWAARRIGKRTTLRNTLEGRYAAGRSGSLVLSQRLGTDLGFDWRPGTRSRLTVDVSRSNYLFETSDVDDGPGMPGAPCATLVCGPAGLDEASARNLDDMRVRLGIDHTLPLPIGRTAVRGGAAFSRVSARGREGSYGELELSLGLTTELPGAVRFDLIGSYRDRAFRHPSTFPDPSQVQPFQEYPLVASRRADDHWQVDVKLTRPIGDALELSARFLLDRQRSNTPVFDYRRHVMGLHATIRY